MARPALATGIEERHRSPCCRIDAALEIQFLLLTGITAERQICQHGRPAATFRYDMIHAQSMRKETLGSTTILTVMAGAPGHPVIKATKIGFTRLGHSFPRMLARLGGGANLLRRRHRSWWGAGRRFLGCDQPFRTPNCLSKIF